MKVLITLTDDFQTDNDFARTLEVTPQEFEKLEKVVDDIRAETTKTFLCVHIVEF